MIRIRDVGTGKEIDKIVPEQRAGFVIRFVALSKDKRFLATCQEPGDKIALWDVRTGEQLRSFTDGVEPYARVIFSADGKWLAAYGGSTRAIIWDTATCAEIRRLAKWGGFTDAAFAPDGSFMTVDYSEPAKPGEVYSNKQIARFWDVTTGVEKARFEGIGLNSSAWSALTSLSGDGKWLFVGGRLWNTETKKEIQSAKIKNVGVSRSYAALSHDDMWLTTGQAGISNPDKHAYIWNLTTGRRHLDFSSKHWILKDQLEDICSIAMSADGSRVAIGHRRSISVWDTANGVKVLHKAALAQEVGLVFATALSREGEFLLAGMFQVNARDFRDDIRLGRARLWSVATGKEVVSIKAFAIK